MTKRSSRRRSSRPPTSRQYPRTARLNALLTEIVAGYFERTDDERIGGFLTVTGVEVDADLNVAQTFVSVLDPDGPGDDGERDQQQRDEAVLAALGSHRRAVQRAISTEAKLRKTPEVVFLFDPAIRSGARIENILAELDDDGPAGR